MGLKGGSIKSPGFFHQHHVLDRPLLGMRCGYFGRSILPFLDPFRQTTDFFLLGFIILFLLRQGFFFLCDEGCVIAGIAFDPMVFDLIGHGYHIVQEDPVVGNYHHRFRVGPQIPFQPFDGRQIQMIRRLIQKQDIRFT